MMMMSDGISLRLPVVNMLLVLVSKMEGIAGVVSAGGAGARGASLLLLRSQSLKLALGSWLHSVHHCDCDFHLSSSRCFCPSKPMQYRKVSPHDVFDPIHYPYPSPHRRSVVHYHVHLLRRQIIPYRPRKIPVLYLRSTWLPCAPNSKPRRIFCPQILRLDGLTMSSKQPTRGKISLHNLFNPSQKNK